MFENSYSRGDSHSILKHRSKKSNQSDWHTGNYYSNDNHDHFDDESNFFVRTIGWTIGLIKSTLWTIILLPKTLISYAIWILTYPIMLPVFAVKNLILLPYYLIKNAVLFVWKILTWPIGEIGIVSHNIWNFLTSIFWRILGFENRQPITRQRAEMYGQTKGRSKHVESIVGTQYIIKPYEIEYGKKVGFFFKTMYYLKWAFYTVLWAATLGYVKKAPSFATPYPAIYRRIVTTIEVDEEPIEPHTGKGVLEEVKSLCSSVLPKNLENLWWLPLLMLLLLVPTFYVGKGIHNDYKNETDTGSVHNPIEYLASKLSSEARFIPAPIRNFPLFTGIKYGFEIVYSIFDIGWKSIELVVLSTVNFLGKILNRFAPWLARPLNYVMGVGIKAVNYAREQVKSLLWRILGLPKAMLTYIYQNIISPLNGLFSGIWNGFRDGFREGYNKRSVEGPVGKKEQTQPDADLNSKGAEILNSVEVTRDDALMTKLRGIVDNALEKEKIEIENRVQSAISEYIGTVKTDVDNEAEALREKYRQYLDRLQQEKAARYNALIDEQMNVFTKSTIPETVVHTHEFPEQVETPMHDLERGREMGESMITDPGLLNVEKELERKMESIALSISRQMNEQHAKFLSELQELKREAKKNSAAVGA